jgi:Response regulators consisting of a CheY-like receiver domain and a winged-helix DNA-binding domain
MDNLKIIDILVIEDNCNDMKLIAKIISTENWKVNFNYLENGIEVMDYLHKKGKYKNCATPSIILLELNLPEKSGLEVLKKIKTDRILKCIPVINSNKF